MAMSNAEAPSSILLLRDLSANVTDAHVQQALAQFGGRIVEVRLIPDQGVCFIDYGSVAAAKVRSSPLSYDHACTRALSRSLTPTHSSLTHRRCMTRPSKAYGCWTARPASTMPAPKVWMIRTCMRAYT